MINPHILDSGERRQFESGAVRDIVDGKGRCDLLPLDIVSHLFSTEDSKLSVILMCIHNFMYTEDVERLYEAIHLFVDKWNGDTFTAVLEVAKHYEEGCNKYGERNWEKGIDLHCYVDSGVRHLLKYFRGDDDEPHDRAFVWNMFGAIWTVKHKPELADIHLKQQ